MLSGKTKHQKTTPRIVYDKKKRERLLIGVLKAALYKLPLSPRDIIFRQQLDRANAVKHA